MARIFPDETAQRLYALCVRYLRTPDGYATDDATGLPVFDFKPALSAAEQTTYNRLLRVATSAVQGITPAEWANLENDIAGLQTFQNLANPTLAQTAAAVKAQSRILRAMLRS